MNPFLIVKTIIDEPDPTGIIYRLLSIIDDPEPIDMLIRCLFGG